MRKLLYIFVLLLISKTVTSKCSSQGLYFWPKGNISTNSIIVIEGYATSEDIIKELGKSYSVYLGCNKQKISLKVRELIEGQYGLTQAILKPETALEKGNTYELIIENNTTKENVAKEYNYNSKEYKKITWNVNSENDIAKPVWKEKPSYLKSEFEELGCGPAMYVYFNYSAADKSELLIKTTVKCVSTGKECSYYLTPENNTISIGHGMCSGAFTFEEKEKYEVVFSLMDASGNISEETSDKLIFNSPF